jgi:hypothetical protein
MRPRTWIAIALLFALAITIAFGQRRGRPRFDDDDEPLVTPPDANEKTEFVFTRLQYPSGRLSGYWGPRGSWSTDYPKADRQFVQGVRRLTRLNVRSVEDVVNLEGDEIYDHPWIYAVEVGHWDLDEKQAAKLRDYLLRGGFLMVDDFHGSLEWEIFTTSLSRVFPDRPVVDLPNSDPIFHVLYNLDERFQIPGIVMFYTGRTFEQDGVEGKWRAIYDDKGRVMVGICHNMDIGDAWEHADMPRYPEHYASLAYRIGINYVVYAMSH